MKKLNVLINLFISFTCLASVEMKAAVRDDLSFKNKEILLCHVKTKIFEQLKKTLQMGADINAKDDTGVTLLMLAAKNGCIDIVKFLLEHNADINSKNILGRTALIDATINGHAHIVELLLKNKADVNAKNNKGYTALMIACMQYDTKVVELLLKYNVDVNAKNNYGSTALLGVINRQTEDPHEIAKICEIAELLLKNGADVNVVDKQNNTTLFLAKGRTKIVELLLKYKADPKIKEKNELIQKATADLFNGVYNNNIEEVKKVLASANIDARDKYSKMLVTALMVASLKGFTEIVELLLKHKADVDMQNYCGETALMLACSKGHTEIVELLLKHSADCSIKDDKGGTVLNFIVNKPELIKIFKNYQEKIFELINGTELLPSPLAYLVTEYLILSKPLLPLLQDQESKTEGC